MMPESWAGDVRRDDRRTVAVLDAEGEDVHALAADAHAAVAEDAAGAVEVDDGRPLLLFAMVLGFGEEAVGGTVLEAHVLQFALSASVADGAVEGVVGEDHLEHGLAGLGDLGGLGLDDHALGDRGGAGGLELGHLLDADEAHAAGGLEREAGGVTEGGDLDAVGLAGFDEERAGGGGEGLAVYFEGYVWHGLVRSCEFGLADWLDLDQGVLDAGAGEVGLELGAEFFDEADCRHRGGVAEGAEGSAHHVFG